MNFIKQAHALEVNLSKLQSPLQCDVNIMTLCLRTIDQERQDLEFTHCLTER